MTFSGALNIISIDQKTFFYVTHISSRAVTIRSHASTSLLDVQSTRHFVTLRSYINSTIQAKVNLSFPYRKPTNKIRRNAKSSEVSWRWLDKRVQTWETKKPEEVSKHLNHIYCFLVFEIFSINLYLKNYVSDSSINIAFLCETAL